MAKHEIKTDSTGKYIVVKQGDTLSAIARDYKSYTGGKTYQQLGQLNGLSNYNLIIIGQKIYLSKGSTSSGGGSSTSAAKKPDLYINLFGQSPTDEKELFATWQWKDASTTAKYKILWSYNLGDSVWYGSVQSTDVDKDAEWLSRQSTFTIPDRAVKVRFKVKPIAETEKKKSGNTETDVEKWTRDWSKEEEFVVNKSLTPAKPTDKPTVEVDKYTLTMSLSGLDSIITAVDFQIVKDNKTVIHTKEKVPVTTGYASYQYKVSAGSVYKVRYRARNGSLVGEWSDEYSDNITTVPEAPKEIIEIRAFSETEVYLKWTAVNPANKTEGEEVKYDIEYTTKKEYFDASDQTTSKGDITLDGEKNNGYVVSGLDTGKEYFFRVRASNSKGKSAWTPIKSVVIGTTPEPPTTWSSVTTATEGEDVMLYWVHNCEDESHQTFAELELYVNKKESAYYEVNYDSSTGKYVVPTDPIEKVYVTEPTLTKIEGVKTTEDDEVYSVTENGEKYYVCIRPKYVKYYSFTLGTENKSFPEIEYTALSEEDLEDGKAHTCVLKTSQYQEGVSVKWRVKTAGVTKTYGDWSIQRTVDIYAQPTLRLAVTNGEQKYYLVEYDTSSGEYKVPTKPFEYILDDTSTLTPVDGVKTTDGDVVYSVNADGKTYLVCIRYVVSDTVIDTVTSFPFFVKAIAGPTSQTPIGYHLSIVSNSIYDTVDNIGNEITINEGQAVYSKYFDTFHTLLVEFTPGNVDLQNNIEYTVNCVVSMDSGLTATASEKFTVAWDDVGYFPTAAVGIDTENYTATIRPYCEDHTEVYHKVEKVGRKYEIVQDVTYDFVSGEPVKGAKTTTGEQVYETLESAFYPVTLSNGVYSVPDDATSIVYEEFPEMTPVVIGTDELGNDIVATTTDGDFVLSVDDNGTTKYVCERISGEEIFFCTVTVVTPITDVKMAVYRREFDGSFTELATDLDGAKRTTITDPHPALDLARYRVVAKTNDTGAVSYADLPGVVVGGKAIIIQWDEDWSSYDVTEDGPLVEPTWTGSLLKLPYNIDVSESIDPEVESVEYIGRSNPVIYYGTHRRETATWNAVIDKSDKETIYALRRLSKWMGDVYVREPSGVGYWAHVVVSFNQTHLDLTIPVTLTITRVEGGA